MRHGPLDTAHPASRLPSPGLPERPAGAGRGAPSRLPATAGVLLPIIVVFLLLISLLAFAYFMHGREEAFRAHRLLWNETLTKAAEGLAEEAYAWFHANPRNPLALFLLGEPGGRPEVSLLGKLTFAEPLKDLGIELVGATMEVINLRPLFSPAPRTPQEAFSSADSGQAGILFPDPQEKGALVRVTIEVRCSRRFGRTYEVVRELKVINPLPGVFSQFTLFVKGKRPGLKGDPNHLRMKRGSGSPSEFGGYADDVHSRLGNPMILVHSPEENADGSPRRAPLPQLTDPVVVAPPFPWNVAAGEHVDRLRRRGWVFMGLDPSIGRPDPPFDSWSLHLLFGGLRHNNLASLPWARFFGCSFLLSNHTTLVYHTEMPDLHRQGIGGYQEFFSKTPPFNGGPGTFYGVLIVVTRSGHYSAYQSWGDPLTPETDFAFYYLDPRRSQETLHGSLIMPFGDVYPLSTTEVHDRRSPTIILGPVSFSFRQDMSQMMQMGDVLYQYIVSHPQADGGELLDVKSRLRTDQRTKRTVLPFFAFDRHGIDPRVPGQVLAWNNPDPWALVRENQPPHDFAGIDYRVTDILDTIGKYRRYMCQMVVAYPSSLVEQMLQNNMAGQKVAAGWLPEPRSLVDIPTPIEPIGPNGTPAAPSAGEFFGEGGDAFRGNRLALRDTANTYLAAGNLAALWPFSDTTVFRDGVFVGATSLDLRQKSTFIVPDQAEFRRRFIREDGAGRLHLNLQGGVVTILAGDLVLDGRIGPGDDRPVLYYQDGGLLIVNGGKLTIRCCLRRDPPEAAGIPLTLATARPDQDIVLRSGIDVRAYLLSSGSLQREDDRQLGFRLKGGVAVRSLFFLTTADPHAPAFQGVPESIFFGHPRHPGERFTVTWDDDFGVFRPEIRQRAYRFHLGPRKSYWKSEPL